VPGPRRLRRRACYQALLLLAVFGSLRWGELAALRYADVDLAAQTIRVSRQLVELRGGGFGFAPPKSDAGKRVVVIPAVIMPIVREHVGRAGDVDADRLIFTSLEGTPLWHANFRQRVWLPALRSAELPLIHFHDLRHTGNMLAAGAGAGLRELMERMGHSTTRAALTYLHASDERQRDRGGHEQDQRERTETSRVGPIGRATGTKATERNVKIISACGDRTSDLCGERGAPSATRTRDLLLRRQLLYPLSYRGRPDQRHGPSAGPLKPNRSSVIETGRVPAQPRRLAGARGADGRTDSTGAQAAVREAGSAA
jgi:hypothetical protein